MSYEITFWIVLVDTDQHDTMPNPIGYVGAEPTLEAAKQSAQAHVDSCYLPNHEPVPLVWERVPPPYDGGIPYLGEQAVTAWRDCWTVWPTVLTMVEDPT